MSPESSSKSARFDWRVALGLAVTVLALWWTVRGVELGEVLREIRGADLGLLTLAVVITTLGFGIRAMRWKVLLRPLEPETTLRSRFAAVSIGFMANNVLPLRVGEFARAYALSRLEPVRASGAFGSLAVERFLDGFTILLLMLVAIAAPDFPAEATVAGRPVGSVLLAMGAVVAVVLLGLVLLLVWPRPVVRSFEWVAGRFLPADTARRVIEALEAFLVALTALRSPGLLAAAMAWSVAFWCWHALSFWVGFRAFGIEASYFASLFMNGIVAFAVAVPSSPGFVGTFHAGVRIALVGVYGVAEEPTLGYAFGYHLGAFVPITVIGLVYAWRLGISFKEIERSEEEVEEEVERDLPELAGRAGLPDLPEVPTEVAEPPGPNDPPEGEDRSRPPDSPQPSEPPRGRERPKGRDARNRSAGPDRPGGSP